MTKAERQILLEEKLITMQTYERDLRKKGVTYIGGVDEPTVMTSATDTPLPPTSQAPSSWWAATAPPHKNPSGNCFVIYSHLIF